MASNLDMQLAAGLADVKTLALTASAYLQQVPADSVLNEADRADLWIPSAASGQRAVADSESAACQAAEQLVSSVTPDCQAVHTPSPPPQPLPILFTRAADHLPANLITAAMMSSPVMHTAACAATAAAPASDATSTAVATLPASLSASEPAVAETDSICTSAMLLPGVPSAAAASVIEPPQAHFCGSSHLHPVAEETLQSDPVTSASLTGPQVAAKLLDPAAATSPLQTEEQGISAASALRPAPIASTAAHSWAIPTSPSPAADLQPTISADAADQQAAAEEAAAAATITHLAPPAVDNWQSNATVQDQQQHLQHQQQQQQQHGRAPLYYEQGGVFPSQVVEHSHYNDGRGQEGAGDLLYEHLAAVLATVPALRDRVLTFAPLHSQLQCSGTDQPGRDAGQ